MSPGPQPRGRHFCNFYLPKQVPPTNIPTVRTVRAREPGVRERLWDSHSEPWGPSCSHMMPISLLKTGASQNTGETSCTQTAKCLGKQSWSTSKLRPWAPDTHTQKHTCAHALLCFPTLTWWGNLCCKLQLQIQTWSPAPVHPRGGVAAAPLTMCVKALQPKGLTSHPTGFQNEWAEGACTPIGCCLQILLTPATPAGQFTRHLRRDSVCPNLKLLYVMPYAKLVC